MNKQWEVGKTYKLVDVRAFREDDDSSSSNNEIADRLESFDYTFTVLKLDGNGYVTKTDNLCSIELDYFVLFNNRDLDRVEIVVTRPEQKVPDVPTTNIIEQWLDKYQQVASADYTIGKIYTSDYGVCLTTDHGDILGSKQVVEFINNRYSQLKSAENQSKLKELQVKKDKLMSELAGVDGEIEQLQK